MYGVCIVWHLNQFCTYDLCSPLLPPGSARNDSHVPFFSDAELLISRITSINVKLYSAEPNLQFCRIELISAELSLASESIQPG